MRVILTDLRDKKMNKILNTFVNLSGDYGSWCRNKMTYEKLQDAKYLFPQIDEALIEERRILINFIEEEVERQVKDGKNPNRIRLGGWFYVLLDGLGGDPLKKLFTKAGLLKVELDPFSENYNTDYEDGSRSEKSDIKILIYESRE